MTTDERNGEQTLVWRQILHDRLRIIWPLIREIGNDSANERHQHRNHREPAWIVRQIPRRRIADHVPVRQHRSRHFDRTKRAGVSKNYTVLTSTFPPLSTPYWACTSKLKPLMLTTVPPLRGPNFGSKVSARGENCTLDKQITGCWSNCSKKICRMLEPPREYAVQPGGGTTPVEYLGRMRRE